MLVRHELRTKRRDEMIDITDKVAAAVRESGVRDGIAVVYCPHTTAGIAVNENADPDVAHDVLLRLSEVFPRTHPGYRHLEGNSDSHLKAVAAGPSQTIIVAEGRLLLGRWQGVFFCEFDGPRSREYYIKIIAG